MVKSTNDNKMRRISIELTIPAGIELSEEEEKVLQNLFFAFGKARRLCYSLRQKYELRGRMSRSEIMCSGAHRNSRYVKEVT